MTRIVTFVILAVILLGVALLFFQLMADFLLPLFISLLLTIIFGPLHRKLTAKFNGRVRLAALAMTIVVTACVLAPAFFLFYRAVKEGRSIYTILAGASASFKDRRPAPLRVYPGQDDQSAPKPDDQREWTVVLSERVAEAATKLGMETKADELRQTLQTKTREWLTPLAVSAGQFAVSALVGLIVTLVSMYYFFADGAGMIRTILRLSPLDEKYEIQLVNQFADIARSVVLAAVLAAMTQGFLAGIGFYFAGVKPVFLLMALTMLLAMIPFVGAAGVWLPVALWLLLIEQRPVAATCIALYGACIVSTIDNVIKPWVLHGRSNIHPLLALLSVLGGVKALGPIGIFIGPMVVAFLQTLLVMLNTEINAMTNVESVPTHKTAEIPDRF